jgi:hypothetical protein
VRKQQVVLEQDADPACMGRHAVEAAGAEEESPRASNGAPRKPPIHDSSADLPEPLGPITVTIRPGLDVDRERIDQHAPGRPMRTSTRRKGAALGSVRHGANRLGLHRTMSVRVMPSRADAGTPAPGSASAAT